MTARDYLDPIKEAEAVKALRASIAAVDPDDDQLLLDTIEGETSFFDLIDGLLLRRLDAVARAEGVAKAIATLEDRKRRFEKQAEQDKALIEQAMALADLQKLVRPAATLSLSRRAPSLVVTEESAIPSAYWKSPAPQLDKKALLDALRERKKVLDSLPEDAAERAAALAAIPEDVPGAELSNGAPSLTIRSA